MDWVMILGMRRSISPWLVDRVDVTWNVRVLFVVFLADTREMYIQENDQVMS